MIEPISVERNASQRELKFSKPADLAAFLNREAEFWDWITKVPAHPYAQINTAVPLST
jgi:hypothetical protein